MTSTSARDDFTKPTLRLMAQRAGYMCSYPDCRQLTIGPSDDRKSGLTMVGVGAHIAATSPEEPRYDGNLTPEERASEANGIWICQLHGKQIDDNEPPPSELICNYYGDATSPDHVPQARSYKGRPHYNSRARRCSGRFAPRSARTASRDAASDG